MCEDRREQQLDVFGDDIPAALEERPRTRGPFEGEAAPDGAADHDRLLLAGRAHELDEPAMEHVVDVDLLRGRPQSVDVVEADDRLEDVQRVVEALLLDDPELAGVEELARRLRAALPESPAPTIVHGDYRLGNMILVADDPGRVEAILDWEMATLGDPLADLGYTLIYWGDISDTPDQLADRAILAVTAQPEATGVPLLRDRFPGGGRSTAFVCRDFACRQPVHDPEALDALLAGG